VGDELKENVIALIPARASSKRVPMKNIQTICGKPLIFFSIKVAQLVAEINDVFVSTEDEEIARIGNSFGARVIPRPRFLSTDDVPNFRVMEHAVAWVEENYRYRVDLLILLQPTNPFRTPRMLKKALSLMAENPESDSLITVKKISRPLGQVVHNNWIPNANLPYRLSNSKLQYILTGNTFILRTQNTLKQGDFLGKRITPLILDQEWIDIDIDTPQDFWLAEALLHKNMEKFSFFDLA
jgi:N-acylneuraminate cytidylyltransferase